MMSGPLVAATSGNNNKSNNQQTTTAVPQPQPTSSAPFHPPATLRILCLHGANSNATLLQKALAHLDERLYEKHGMELVFVNSPLSCCSGCAAPSSSSSLRREEPRRVWWEDDEDEKTFVGLDASLMLLRQIWTATPFCGVLAVGQGAAVASMLPFLMTKTTPMFGIFVHGQALLEEDELLIMPDDDDSNSWPCLHVIDAGCESSKRLSRQLGGHVHVGNSAKITKVELNVIGKFLVEQKKRLRHDDDGGGYAIVLQHQLHWVEQQAAQLVAQHIASHPPRALMAVITPQAAGIGCWQRRQPNDEGGGAPCPPDFLLKREKRSGAAQTNDDDNGPSRHHPNNNASGGTTTTTTTTSDEEVDDDNDDDAAEGSIGKE